MRVFEAAALCLTLGGCAGVNYILQEYRGVPLTEVVMPEDTYRIFDKPGDSKMMVTPSLGASAAQGFGSGLTFNIVDNTPPKPRFALQSTRNSPERRLS